MVCLDAKSVEARGSMAKTRPQRPAGSFESEIKQYVPCLGRGVAAEDKKNDQVTGKMPHCIKSTLGSKIIYKP